MRYRDVKTQGTIAIRGQYGDTFLSTITTQLQHRGNAKTTEHRSNTSSLRHLSLANWPIRARNNAVTFEDLAKRKTQDMLLKRRRGLRRITDDQK
jgi:hypothetical protein